MIKKIEEYIENKEDSKDNILEVLLVAQEINGGTIDKEIQEVIARKLEVDPEEIRDTVEFFPFLREAREKVKVEVCMGTSCYMAGNSILEGMIKEKAGDRVEIVERECSEACDYGPRVCVKHRTFQYVAEEDIDEILEFAKKEWEK